MNIFNEVFGNEDAPKPAAQAKAVPDLPMDDWRWQLEKPASGAGATKILRDDLTEAVCGDCPMELSKIRRPDPELAKDANDRTVDLMLKSGGIAGARLKRMLQKSPVTLTEAMYRMLDNFSEFFSVEDQRLLKKQILSLDLSGFLEMFNAKVINARLS